LCQSFIGEQIGTHLIHLCTGNHLVALRSAKLLRSIAVYRNNKLILQPEISAILELVQNAGEALQITLAAVIWNLSSLCESFM